jgi:hypothetical protein
MQYYNKQGGKASQKIYYAYMPGCGTINERHKTKILISEHFRITNALAFWSRLRHHHYF